MRSFRFPANRQVLVAAAAYGIAFVLAAVVCLTGPVFSADRAGHQKASFGAIAAASEAESPEADSISTFDPPRVIPDLHFVDGEGRPLSLSGFQGRPIVLNIWATWCVPCRQEMPSLDRLQTKFSGTDLLVLPLSIDRTGISAVKRFYAEVGLKSLGVYVDQSSTVQQLLALPGIPATLLLNRDLREVGGKFGAAAWDNPEIVALIRDRLDPHPSVQTTEVIH